MRHMHRFLLSSGLLATLALGACGGDTGDDFALDTSRLDTLGGAAAPATAPMPTESRSFASDAEIQAFLSTTNAFEIQDAELASERASSAEVREFANTIREDHQSLMQRLSDVTGSAQGSELPSGDQFVMAHENMVAQLQSMQGEDFDRAWLDAQVQMHERALQGIEDALNANPSEELRTVLTEAQTGMQAHLDRARQLRDQVGVAGGAAPMSDTGVATDSTTF